MRKFIIEEIKRTAIDNDGIPLGRKRFAEATGIPDSDWMGKIWARWGDAIKEAGFEPQKFQTAFSDDLVIHKLAEFIARLDKFPVNNELRIEARNDADFPSHNVFTRVGSKSQLIDLILTNDFVRESFPKVIEICEKEKSKLRKSIDPTQAESESIEIGFVYLLKSGQYYKIGYSFIPEVREYNLGTKLPHKPKIIHKIRTDDPVGIETYWHKRFESLRMNGEWFALRQEEIQIFKRRKFM